MVAVAEEAKLRIGVLAERVGVNPKTIRYYEEIGLLPAPERSASGYRLYRSVDADRLRFIKGVQQLGFSLGEIGEILALRDRGEAPCRYVADRLESRWREIDRQVAELERLKRELERLRERSSRLPAQEPAADAYCHILEGP